jgi:hypothetical protein
LATPERRYGPGAGITLGGIVVILGIVFLVMGWTFGGFARGRWY